MAGKLGGRNLLSMCAMVAAALLSQMVVSPVMCEKTRKGRYQEPLHRHKLAKASTTRQDHSNLCQRRPSCPVDPPTPPQGGGGGYATPTPSHGGGGYYSPPGGVSPPTPVVDPGIPAPSNGGGGGYYSPPGGVSTPSPVVDPGIPAPSHGGGGGYYSPPGGVSTPSPVVDPGMPTPSGGGYNTPPGGVFSPSPVVGPWTPATPTYPLVPSPVVGPGTPATPTYPLVPSPVLGPPTYPLVPPTPYTPGISTPPSPFVPDPNQIPPFFTGSSNYWRTHPQVIWGIFGYWATLGGFLGAAGTPAARLGVLEALRNTRTDGVGTLYREGTAAFLNSVVNPRGFAFSTPQVRDAFAAALASEQAAANQARVFMRANLGLLRRH